MNILWISETPWGLIKQRQNHLIENLPADWKVLFAEPLLLKKYSPWTPKQTGNLIKAAIPLVIHQKLTQSLHENVLSPITAHYLNALTRYFDMRKDLVVITSNIYSATFMHNLKARLLCYDCHDNHKAFPNVPEWAGIYVDRLVKECDLIFASAELLLERCRSERGKTFYVGNGCDKSFFRNVSDVPAEMKDIPRPVAGYVGAFSEWFEFEMIAKIAKDSPDISFVLIGPVEPHVHVRNRFDALMKNNRNIYYLGRKPYAELPEYISCFDVGLIPFHKTELTMSVNPNKLYEYAALAVPVVSTDFSPDLNRYKDVIFIAKNAGEFKRHIDSALRSEADREALRQIALSNRWEIKANEMVNIIRRELGVTTMS